ncbi:MAG: hypothetical protein LBJ75_00270 [Puniceicoccales bacterium]|jgi:hypothetical protein|nr:hypothetical protein [Puniceicoccales bacterium]
MNGINSTTNYWVDTWRETSVLGDEKLLVGTTHGVGSSSNPRILGIGTNATAPSHLLSLRNVEAFVLVVAPRADPQQILVDAVRKAYFSRTDGIDDEMWDDVYDDLTDMPLKEARGIWQTVANVVAIDCVSPDGNVDKERLKVWMKLLGNAETFQKEPYCFIPHAEFMRSQMHAVCESLVLNSNDARDLLNADKSITVGECGKSTLDVMSEYTEDAEPEYTEDAEPEYTEDAKYPAVAILASLLAPHRQFDLPTCTIDSTINAEIRNHPERLIKIYTQMLGGDQIPFPSGHALLQQLVGNGSITVDLRNGE